ncbi:MAG: class I SAM-dependent methyltransferase [Candidatus Micrarchaeota archaeon]|nr:class I SAM-dependent methyltransferase [Candidatus Micrarchaeota archaeon]
MAPTQDEIFQKSEADRWFLRNKDYLSKITPDKDPIMKAISEAGIKPKSALEIGASNGYRLAMIRALFKAKCVAVEPSSLAIADGKKRYDGIDFRKGVAHKLPMKKGEKFDLVILNFVFHWIDRRKLFHSFAEIDAAVTDGGWLAIGDFYSKEPTKVPYRHIKKGRVWTYKQDYAEVFIKSGIYRRVLLKIGSVAKRDFLKPQSDYDSFAVSILKKSLDGYYSLWEG